MAPTSGNRYGGSGYSPTSYNTLPNPGASSSANVQPASYSADPMPMTPLANDRMTTRKPEMNDLDTPPGRPAMGMGGSDELPPSQTMGSSGLAGKSITPPPPLPSSLTSGSGSGRMGVNDLPTMPTGGSRTSVPDVLPPTPNLNNTVPARSLPAPEPPPPGGSDLLGAPPPPVPSTTMNQPSKTSVPDNMSGNSLVPPAPGK
jgi:hypothetical protein